MNEFYGYVRDLKTGNLIGINSRRSYEILAMNDIELIKQRKEHNREFEIIPLDEEIEAPKKAGRPARK